MNKNPEHDAPREKKRSRAPLLVLLTLIALLGLAALIYLIVTGPFDPRLPAAESPEPTASAPAETEKPDDKPKYDAATVTPAMWKVTDAEGHTLYLFGTIHVGDERNYMAMEKIQSTLDACDALAVEFDLKEYEGSVDMQKETALTFLYADGRTIKDVMPQELYDQIVQLLQDAGAYSKLLDRYNLPFWTTLAEQAVMMTHSDLASEFAMDSQLIDRAYENGQKVYSVESAKLQYDLLNSMSDELCLASLRELLDSVDTYGDDLMELYTLWLSGDEAAIRAYLAEEEELDPAYYTPEVTAMAEAFEKAMGPDRNDGMFAKIKEYLASGETVFFAVGEAHMLDEHGLIELLTNAGYTVERFDYEA